MDKNGLKRKNLSLKIGAILVVAYFVIIAFFPGAVENHGDITDKLLIVTVGIDKSEQGLIVSGISIEPQSTGADGGQVVELPVKASGRSISECLNFIQQRTGKSVDLGLCGVIVVGDEIAKEGVKTLLETTLSSNLVSSGAYVVQADGTSAEEFIKRSTSVSGSATVILTQLLKDAEKNSGVMANTLLGFLSETGGRSGNSFMPLASFSEDESGNSSTGSQKSAGGEQQKKYTANEIKEMAVYKDGAMIGKLGPHESKGITWMDKHVEHGVIVKEHFIVEGEDVGTVSAELAKKSFGIKVEFKDGKPMAKISVKASFKSADRERVNRVSMDKRLNAGRLDQIYSENFKLEIESQVGSAVEYCKQNSVDLYGIEQEFYRWKTKEYKRFIGDGKNLLAECDVTYDVEVEIL